MSSISSASTLARCGDGSTLGKRSAVTTSVFGTYFHGVFENKSVREAFLDTVFRTATTERPSTTEKTDSPYAAAAELIAPVSLSAFADEIVRS